MTTTVRKPQIKWTDDKIIFLKENYPLCSDKKTLAKNLGISYGALKDCARRFKIKSKTDPNHYKLKPLYEESCLAYYWMGFILADGYITEQGELKVTTSMKDETHLNKLADFLNVKLHYYDQKTALSNDIRRYCKLTCKDVLYGKRILEKFDIKRKKTYNPPLKIIDNNILFLSLLIGLIDGDGTFSKVNGKCNFIRIEIHKNWTEFLIKIKDKLNSLGLDGIKVKENKRGYVHFLIYRNSNFSFLKDFIIKNDLPTLERKWNCVNPKMHRLCKD